MCDDCQHWQAAYKQISKDAKWWQELAYLLGFFLFFTAVPLLTLLLK